MTTERRARAALRRALDEALASVDLRARTAESLGAIAGDDGSVDVVAAGKAAPTMMRGALDALGRRVARALVVRPGCVAHRPFPRDVRVLEAGHPVPDARSVRAAEAALAMARSASGPLVVLISGGASSLLCAPADGLTLAMKRRIVAALIHRSIPISDINCVRAHLSRIKGGRLLAAAGDRHVVTVIASDVIAGSPSDVGSGPSVPRARDRMRAARVLRSAIPGSSGVVLHPVPSFPRGRLRAVHTAIVACPEELAERVAVALQGRGVAPRVLTPFQGELSDVAREYVRRARTLSPGAAWVRAAEPHLDVPGSRLGRGGRSTHLAALTALDLPPGVLLLVAATDGVDGSSGTGGAIVASARGSGARREAFVEALRSFDTGALLVATGEALPGAATGHNLADVHVLLRYA